MTILAIQNPVSGLFCQLESAGEGWVCQNSLPVRTFSNRVAAEKYLLKLNKVVRAWLTSKPQNEYMQKLQADSMVVVELRVVVS